MILEFETLKPLIHGAQIVKKEDDKLLLSRFSECQLESLKDYRAGGITRPSSVYLEFETDAEWLSLSYKDAKSETAVTFLNFALYENGVLTALDAKEPILRPEGEKWVSIPDGEVHFSLSEGRKRVSIYMPLIHFRLSSVSLNDGASVMPIRRKGMTVAYGDSITEGFYSEIAGMSYFDQLCRSLNSEGINMGVGGSIFRAEYLPPASVPECDRVLVAFGTNDFRRATKERFDEGMSGFFRLLFEQVREKPVYVILPIWRKSERKVFVYGEDLFAVREAIAAEASKYPNAVIINGREMTHRVMPFMHDPTHPNALGHSHYAANLLKEIQKYEKL